MTGNEQRALFDAAAEPMSLEAQIAQARKCTSRKHAWRMCFDVSALEPKQVYGALGIDQARFSKIYSGKAYPDPDSLFPLMDICGNHIPLHYDAMHANCQLVPIKTTLEEENAALKAELNEERRLNQRLAQMLGGR